MDIKCSSIEHMDNLSTCCMDENVLCIQHMEIFSLCCIDIMFLSIQHMGKLSICCIEKCFVHTAYIQIVHMFYGQLHYHCAFVRTDWINYIINVFINEYGLEVTKEDINLYLTKNDDCFDIKWIIDFRKGCDIKHCIQDETHRNEMKLVFKKIKIFSTSLYTLDV